MPNAKLSGMFLEMLRAASYEEAEALIRRAMVTRTEDDTAKLARLLFSEEIHPFLSPEVMSLTDRWEWFELFKLPIADDLARSVVKNAIASAFARNSYLWKCNLIASADPSLLPKQEMLSFLGTHSPSYFQVELFAEARAKAFSVCLKDQVEQGNFEAIRSWFKNIEAPREQYAAIVFEEVGLYTSPELVEILDIEGLLEGLEWRLLKEALFPADIEKAVEILLAKRSALRSALKYARVSEGVAKELRLRAEQTECGTLLHTLGRQDFLPVSFVT